MLFIIAQTLGPLGEYIKSNIPLVINLYNDVIRVEKKLPDIEIGIQEQYVWSFRIPVCYSTQEELDELV